MVQGPGIVAPLDWTIKPEVFPQLPQNIAIEISIHGPSWLKKLLMHDAFSVKGTNCFKLVVLPCVAVNLASPIEMSAASSQRCVYKPKVHRQ
jgi:hypothetical protein